MTANSPSADSKMDARNRRRILKILESNWQAEMRGFHTYEILAERETDPSRRAAFRTLSSAEQHHARLWAGRIRALGGPDPVYNGPKTGEADTIANRVGGVRMALRRLELDESRDIAKYAKQMKELGDEPSIRILQQALEDEREHYRTLSGLIRNRRPIAPSSPEQAKQALDELLAARQEEHPKAAGVDRGRHLRNQRRSRSDLRNRFRRFRSDPGQQQICHHRGDGGHDCERALDGFRRLSRGKK